MVSENFEQNKKDSEKSLFFIVYTSLYSINFTRFLCMQYICIHFKKRALKQH